MQVSRCRSKGKRRLPSSLTLYVDNHDQIPHSYSTIQQETSHDTAPSSPCPASLSETSTSTSPSRHLARPHTLVVSHVGVSPPALQCSALPALRYLCLPRLQPRISNIANTTAVVDADSHTSWTLPKAAHPVPPALSQTPRHNTTTTTNNRHTMISLHTTTRSRRTQAHPGQTQHIIFLRL